MHSPVPRAISEPANPKDRLEKRPNWLARLMSLFIVVAVGRIGDLVPLLHEIPLAKLVAVIGIIAAFRNRATIAAATWKTVPPARLMIGVMGITTLSILWSVFRSATFGVITGTVLAVLLTTFLVIKASSSWEPVKTILRGTVFASIVLVVMVFTSRVRDSNGFRAGVSFTYDPNDFAFVLVGMLPLVIIFGIISRGTKKLFYFGIAGLATVSILLTQSRGGFLGLISGVVLMTFLLPITRRGRLTFRASASGVIARVILLASIGLIVWHTLPESARTRLGSITELGSDYNTNLSEEAVTSANAGRLAIWTRNLPLVLERPWGFGAGSFGLVDGRYAGGRYRAPHNTLLQALIEIGIPGFILFISTIVSCLRFLRIPQKTQQHEQTDVQDEPRAFARGLAIGWVGLCVSGFFLSQLYSNVLWTFVMLSCAVGIARRLPSTTISRETAMGSVPQRIADKKRIMSDRSIAKSSR
jgi:O-antigen ligase